MTFLRSCILFAGATVALTQPEPLSDLKKIQEHAALKNIDKIQATAALKTLTEKLQEPTAASFPMHPSKSACFQDAHLHLKKGAASLLQHHNVPGAGVDKFKPFEKVLKDGFLAVECVKDYMYYNGDKFGDNKHDYKLSGPNVSIVHYDAFIAKEDQAEMTQKKCFEFCRTVPNMGYFGVVNGRQCYCTPYYTAMESDDSQCDVLCEGEQTTFCGGESKSSVFAMHMCDTTEEDLGKVSKPAKEMVSEMGGLVKLAKGLSSEMQKMGAKLQKQFGAVGDSGATALLQNAKVFAGELVHKAEDAEVAAKSLGLLTKAASSLSKFTSPATVTKAERLMEDIEASMAKADAVHDELVTLEALAKGEHEARAPLVHQGGASSPEFQMGSNGAQSLSGNAATSEKVGKLGWYNPGPWFLLCRGTDCTEEKCLPDAVAKEECQGFFEVWNRKTSTHTYCFCRTAQDFDESKMVNYGGSWTPQTFKYTLPPKRPQPLEQYYPAMYFVDKRFEEMPTTCTGDLVAKPIAGQSANSCAASCDSHIHSCVAFQFFKDENKNTMCFLFSKFSTGMYYTGCSQSLRGDAAPGEAKCYAKLSKFVGTTLKPDPSGKCEQCFSDITKAERCYK